MIEKEEILSPVTEGFGQLIRRVFKRVQDPAPAPEDVSPSWTLTYAEERVLDLITFESSAAGESIAKFWVTI